MMSVGRPFTSYSIVRIFMFKSVMMLLEFVFVGR
jgi:hypothetical protein